MVAEQVEGDVHHAEEGINFPLGPVLAPLLGLYAVGAVVFAGMLGEGYWSSILLETGIGVVIYLLLGLALTQHWHRSPGWFIIGGISSAIGLLAAGAFGAPSGYWRALTISLGVGLALVTVLEFSLHNQDIADIVEAIASEVAPQDIPPSFYERSQPAPRVQHVSKRGFLGGPWDGQEKHEYINDTYYQAPPSRIDDPATPTGYYELQKRITSDKAKGIVGYQGRHSKELLWLVPGLNIYKWRPEPSPETSSSPMNAPDEASGLSDSPSNTR
jgi:hypothetical protein